MPQDTKRSTIVNVLKKFLAQQGDVRELRAMSDDLKVLIATETKQHTAVITTATPLMPEDQTAVEQEVSQLNPDLAFEYRVDASILGGLRVQINDEIYDLTVAQALEQLKNRLKQ